ncbi:MAG: putative selenium-dependent hydroxylase accessory protein YqeC [Acidobacteria bacterium]|nr:MAG: putative selenium-dependent hydroxylase accessory protein YqeC [Acidobacteriota bacterium]
MTIAIDSGLGLADALSVGKGDVVSLVGAGGKTTVLYALTAELQRQGLSVVATSTTHLQMPMAATTMPPLVVVGEEDNWLTTVKARLRRYGSVTVIQDRERGDKLGGVDPVMLDPLRSLADCVVIEADGARGRCLKAPASHEPVIPDETTLTVILVGLDALDHKLDAEHVHRLEIVASLSGTSPGMEVTDAVIAAAIVKGYLPKIPKGSRHIVLLNKAAAARLKAAERIGERLLQQGVSEVVFGEAIRPNECFYRMRPEAE